MQKYNSWSLPRVTLPERKIILKDAAQPSAPPFEITLRALTFPEATVAADVGKHYAGMFSGEKSDGTLKRFPSPDGALELSEAFCVTLATVEAMQVVDTEEDRYIFGDLVGLSVRLPNGFNMLLEAAGELMEGTNLGNSSGAERVTSPDPPSTSDTPTPNGVPSSPLLSGA